MSDCVTPGEKTRYEITEEVFPRRSVCFTPTLPDICINFRQSLNGAADPWEPGLARRTLDMLKRRLEMWTPGDAFDECVRKLVEEAVKLGEKELFSPCEKAKSLLENWEGRDLVGLYIRLCSVLGIPTKRPTTPMTMELLGDCGVIYHGVIPRPDVSASE